MYVGYAPWSPDGCILMWFVLRHDIRAGVDAARAFGTGCFKDHRTHDLRGLSESEIHVSTHQSPPSPKGLFLGGATSMVVRF